jgi:hypothetical protein
MVNNRSVAFDCAIHREVAAISSVGNFSILKELDG